MAFMKKKIFKNGEIKFINSNVLFGAFLLELMSMLHIHRTFLETKPVNTNETCTFIFLIDFAVIEKKLKIFNPF